MSFHVWENVTTFNIKSMNSQLSLVEASFQTAVIQPAEDSCEMTDQLGQHAFRDWQLGSCQFWVISWPSGD